MIRAMTVAVILGALCVVPAAYGQACKSEIEKHCKDVKAGGGLIIKCLRDHDAELSDMCRAYLNSVSRYMACLDDAVRLCPHMEPGTANLMACLRTHMTDLSSECKRELERLRQ